MDTVQPTIQPAASFRRGWAIFVFLLAGLSIAFLRVHKVADAREAGLPLVVADTAKLDFGEGSPGEVFEWPVPITNRTDSEVVVFRVETSCGCTVIEPSSFAILQGQTVELRIQITLKTNVTTRNLAQSITLSGLSVSDDVVFRFYVGGILKPT